MSKITKTLKQDLKDLKKLDPQTKVYVIIFIILIFIASILTSSSFISPGNSPSAAETENQTENITEEPTTTLSITPSSDTLSVGDVIAVSVILSKTPVTAVDISLSYDPKVFGVSDIKKGSVFPTLLNQKIEAGKIIVSASIDPEGAKNPTTGDVFSFSLKALVPSENSLIQFDKELTTTAVAGENTLGLTVDANFTVQ